MITQFTWIDVAKLLMCFFVVSVHVCYVFPTDSLLPDFLGHLAVPVFFVISGFFFGRQYLPASMGERRIIVRKFLSRILLLYVIWTAIYLPIAFTYLLHHHSLQESLLLYVRNVLLTGQNMMSWHLWYLHAMIVAILMIHFFSLCKLRLWMIFTICTCLFFVGLYVDAVDNPYTQAYKQVLCDTQNGFFRGGFYMTLGMILSRMTGRAVRLYLACVFFSLISFMLDIPVYYPLFSFGFAGILLNIPNSKILPSAFSNWCRKASTFIYLFHFLPIVFLQQILHWQGGFLLGYVVVIVICLAAAWLTIRLSSIDKFPVIKMLY